MAIDVVIKPGGLFKKQVSLENILDDTMDYGIMDESFRLHRGETGEYTVIFRKDRLVRGMEVSFEGKTIYLRQPLPTDRDEICWFYSMVKKICGMAGASGFYHDGSLVGLREIPQLTDDAVTASETALADMADMIISDEYRSLTVFGAIFPLAIGAREMHRIGNSTDAFGTLLHELQSVDAYYAAPKIYSHTGNEQNLFGLYIITEDVVSIVPRMPFVIMNQIEGVEDWYAVLYISEGEKYTVRYEDFISSIPVCEYFDAEHVVIQISTDEMRQIGMEHHVEIQDRTEKI